MSLNASSSLPGCRSGFPALGLSAAGERLAQTGEQNGWLSTPGLPGDLANLGRFTPQGVQVFTDQRVGQTEICGIHIRTSGEKLAPGLAERASLAAFMLTLRPGRHIGRVDSAGQA